MFLCEKKMNVLFLLMATVEFLIKLTELLQLWGIGCPGFAPW